MSELTSTAAIRNLLKGEGQPSFEMSQFVAFKNSYSPEEWDKMGKDACESLGATHVVKAS